MSRVGMRWLAAALLALVTAWGLAPASVPVFDGIGQPDEPYRYVDPPPTAKTTKAPASASVTVPVRNGKNVGQFVNTSESGPQISIYAAPGSLAVPPDATSVTIAARPLAPSSPLPTDGDIVSNVYRVSATAGGEQPAITGRGTQGVSLDMRAPSAKQPGPVFEQRTATGWEQLKTIRSGNDIYHTSAVTKFGDFALVQLTSTGDSGGGINVGLLVGGLALLLVAVVVLAIRLNRSRASAT